MQCIPKFDVHFTSHDVCISVTCSLSCALYSPAIWLPPSAVLGDCKIVHETDLPTPQTVKVFFLYFRYGSTSCCGCVPGSSVKGKYGISHIKHVSFFSYRFQQIIANSLFCEKSIGIFNIMQSHANLPCSSCRFSPTLPLWTGKRMGSGPSGFRIWTIFIRRSILRIFTRSPLLVLVEAQVLTPSLAFVITVTSASGTVLFLFCLLSCPFLLVLLCFSQHCILQFVWSLFTQPRMGFVPTIYISAVFKFSSHPSYFLTAYGRQSLSDSAACSDFWDPVLTNQYFPGLILLQPPEISSPSPLSPLPIKLLLS